ncbi:hypothetical protein ACS0TY_025726 [Phlomoides rotata]
MFCSIKDGGISPKFLIIDDGWQETTNEFQKEGEPLIEEKQPGTKLKYKLRDGWMHLIRNCGTSQAIGYFLT